MNIMELWEKAKIIIRSDMNEVFFNTFIKDLKPHVMDGDTLKLISPAPYISAWLSNDNIRKIEDALSAAAARKLHAAIISAEDAEPVQPKQAPVVESATRLNPKYTFDTFVVGNNNRFAHAAALSVAESPAQNVNPLFIYGGVGLGKTHLMHAIGHYVRQQHPESRLLYITSEEFTNELISAIQHNSTEEFRNRFRKVDVLMVDDIQFIAGKRGTEEEFFHTFNHLRDAGKQIVMTSDKPPKEIQKLEERLCSRFEGGLVADIQRPNFETRMAILRKKTEFEHLNIDDEILALIAEKIETNIRELEGSLTRLTAYSSLTRRPIDMQLAREALRELFKHTETRLITCDSIQEAVANYYGITVGDLKSPKRSHEITVPRQIAMYLCREMMGLSLTRIGDAFGGRHYTTVMSSIEKVEQSIKQSPSLASLLDDVRRMIKDSK